MTVRSPRVVSLIPSGSEMICALGLGKALVGRSHECDFPPAIADRPVLTRHRLQPARPSAEIDRDVRTLLAEALSIYSVDSGALAALRPDVIVTQTQCAVCAVSEADLRAALHDAVGPAVEILSLEAVDLAGIWQDLARLAAALGVPERGTDLTAKLRARVDTLTAEASRLLRRRVACIEWLDPLMVAGNWVPELVTLAGGDDCLGETASHGAWVDFADLAAADPEVLVTLPCGFDIARTREELPVLTAQARWPGLSAVRAGRVCLTDGNQYFNRPGPRIVESLEILAEILHPQTFDFGHRGRGWQPLEVC